MINLDLCRKCFYSVFISGGSKGSVYCDYISKTGHMRPKGGEDMYCPVFNPTKKPRVYRSSLDYIYAERRTDETTI